MRISLLLSGLLLLAGTTSATADDTKCRPFTSRGAGPLFKINQPVKTNSICDASDAELPNRFVTSNCYGPICLSLEDTGVPNYPVQISGQVLGPDCEEVHDVEFHFWQSGTSGFKGYGDMRGSADRGECRSVVLAPTGEFSVTSDYPPNYGLTAGVFPFDFPPYFPSHTHVLVYAPGYQVLVTQLYFDEDHTRLHDFRALFADLGHDDPDIHLTTTLNGNLRTTTVNFVLNTSTENISKDQAIFNAVCQGDPMGSLYYCNPGLEEWFAWSPVVPNLAVLLSVLYIGLPGLAYLAFLITKWGFKSLK